MDREKTRSRRYINRWNRGENKQCLEITMLREKAISPDTMPHMILATQSTVTAPAASHGPRSSRPPSANFGFSKRSCGKGVRSKFSRSQIVIWVKILESAHHSWIKIIIRVWVKSFKSAHHSWIGIIIRVKIYFKICTEPLEGLHFLANEIQRTSAL